MVKHIYWQKEDAFYRAEVKKTLKFGNFVFKWRDVL